MAVLMKSKGMVIGFLQLPGIGIRLYVVYGGTEMALELDPVRMVEGDAPAWLQEMVVHWVRRNRLKLIEMAQQRCQLFNGNGSRYGQPQLRGVPHRPNALQARP